MPLPSKNSSFGSFHADPAGGCRVVFPKSYGILLLFNIIPGQSSQWLWHIAPIQEINTIASQY